MEPTESRYGAPPTPNEIIDLCGDDSDSSVSGSDHPAVPKEAPTEDEGDSDNEGSEDFDDSESLLQDILDFEPDPSELPIYQDIIDGDEAATLKKHLHEVGPNRFVFDNISTGRYTAKRLITAFGVTPPPAFEGRSDQGYLRLLGLAIVRELAVRRKLPQYNTIEDAVKLLKEKSNIMVITGAGISTSLGIPDFRSKNTGFYDQMREKGFDSPEDIFDLERFKEDASVFYRNSGQTLPELGRSTPTHAFIKLIEDQGRLLTNYTQNIDNIEANVGLSKDKVLQCHGSWATFTCMQCKCTFPGEQFYQDVREKRVARCPRADCKPLFTNGSLGLKRKRKSKSRVNSDGDSDDDGQYDILEQGVMKPDITFFHEKLQDRFFDRFRDRDWDKVDLVIVIGTSMTVAPVSEIPIALPPHIPHINISRDRIRHMQLDITFLGDCDTIVAELARRAGWKLEHPMLPEDREADISIVDDRLGIWEVRRKGAANGDNEDPSMPSTVAKDINGERQGSAVPSNGTADAAVRKEPSTSPEPVKVG